MRLFNTLTQQIEPLRPFGERITLYVCGITPYDTTHLGHAFVNVVYDTLVRHLRFQDRAVTYVQNVTDIDDDVLRKAREIGVPWDELGRRETECYLHDLRALNVAPPDYYIWATDEIAEMVKVVEVLLSQGLAYQRDGWVYYSVKRDPDFGKLAEAAGIHGYESWLRTANERGNFPDDPRKDDPLDFVLWQGQQPGEPAWTSPWGPGRPGWHIECSTIAIKYLGSRIDIHGGGADLIFPHHTCEIAQSEHATGEAPFVNIWMHCAMVGYQGEKMSKSLGNLVLVQDLLTRYSADAIRILLLSHHYRQPWEFTESEMERCAELAGVLKSATSLASSANNLSVEAVQGDPEAERARADFSAALDDDLNTPRALGILEQLAATAPQLRSLARISTLIDLAGVLGLTLNRSVEPNADEPTSPARTTVI